MNIFATDRCPIQSARWLPDKLVVKMGLESCQLIATCFSLDRLAASDCPRTQKGKPRGHFNPKHPSSLWTRASRANLQWLLCHTEATFEEKYARYPKGGRHFSHDFLDWAINRFDDCEVESGLQTEFSVAINEDKQCRRHPHFEKSDVVGKYRLYISMDKPYASWIRNKPFWMDL